jgi:hypothetical protein
MEGADSIIAMMQSIRFTALSRGAPCWSFVKAPVGYGVFEVVSTWDNSPVTGPQIIPRRSRHPRFRSGFGRKTLVGACFFDGGGIGKTNALPSVEAKLDPDAAISTGPCESPETKRHGDQARNETDQEGQDSAGEEVDVRPGEGCQGGIHLVREGQETLIELEKGSQPSRMKSPAPRGVGLFSRPESRDGQQGIKSRLTPLGHFASVTTPLPLRTSNMKRTST